MTHRGEHNYRSGHSVELLRSGMSTFDTFEKVIRKAKHYIHLQTYIIDEDEAGTRIVEALAGAARRGIRVYLLLDAFGTRYLSDGFMRKIEDSGIMFRFFSPAFITKGFQLSLRLHHKVLLVDGETAIIGGLNFADRYRGTLLKKEWLDFALLIRGPECAHVNGILKRIWNKTFISKNERAREVVHNPGAYDENIRIRVLENNWYRNKIEILRSYRSAFKHSHRSMIIFASYFLPGRNERKLLRNAASRGVDIRIVLPSESDAPMFKRATNFLYGFILSNRIRIFEYLPSNLHAKVAAVDGRWCTIGSYNLNHLSDYGSIEINADVIDEDFTSRFEKILNDIIRDDCREVTSDVYMKRRTWISRLSDWTAYQTIRLLMRLMFFMTSKKAKPGNS